VPSYRSRNTEGDTVSTLRTKRSKAWRKAIAEGVRRAAARKKAEAKRSAKAKTKTSK
jgi:hypothetical protein